MGEEKSNVTSPPKKKTWVCDGCSSWTAGELTQAEVESWGWVFASPDDDGETYVYCPECS